MAILFGASGSGKHIKVGKIDPSDGLSEISIFSWATFDGFQTSDARIISKATGQSVSQHFFMLSTVLSGGNYLMRVRLKTGGTVTTHYEDSTLGSLSVGTLYHLGFVYDGSNILFYRNGVENGSSSKTGTIDSNTTTDVRIADNPGSYRKELEASLEDIRIYERALSEEEVRTMYACCGTDNIWNGLKHRWVFNEGYEGQISSGDDSIKDITGNQHGTPASSPPYEGSKLRFR